jgi:very-short-patch-repair endonuclease
MRDTKAYRDLPFNPRLKQRARALRKAGNLAEVLLWNQIKRGQFHGLDFDRQKRKRICSSCIGPITFMRNGRVRDAQP